MFKVLEQLDTPDAIGMNSREMARMLGKTHANFINSLRSMVRRGQFAAKESVYDHPTTGQRCCEFILTREQCLKVATLLPEKDGTVVRKHFGVAEETPAPVKVELGNFVLAGAANTMSSLEIAELTGKRHDNVMADIRKMLTELAIGSTQFSGQYIDTRNRALPCFNLPSDLTITLLTGYSIPLRAKVLDRLRELERQLQKPAAPVAQAPTNLRDALLLAADLEEHKLMQEQMNDGHAPALNLNDAATVRKMLLSFTE